jgi:GGDEF domain-containing protein
VVFEKDLRDRAAEMMDKVRSTLEKRKFFLRGQRKPGYSGLHLPFRKSGEKGGRRAHITVSVGVATTDKSHRTAEEVIKRADHFLYEAKENGRNRVVFAN